MSLRTLPEALGGVVCSFRKGRAYKRGKRYYHFGTVVILFCLLVLCEHVERRTQKIGRLLDVKDGRERHGEYRESMCPVQQGESFELGGKKQKNSTTTPLLHRSIIEHAIKLRARHGDRMKPMTPPTQSSMINEHHPRGLTKKRTHHAHSAYTST